MNSAYTIVCLGLLLTAAPATVQPHTIERGISQLFVDDFLIAEQENLVRTLHQPVKENGGNAPVITLPKDAFGGYGFTLQAGGSIVYDTRLKLYVMLALGYSSEMGGDKARSWEKARLYRFTSPDGLEWSDGEWVFPHSPDDLRDATTGKSATNMDAFSCYYDATDAAWPYKGLMWFANWGEKEEGSYYVRSADGLHWARGVQVFDGNAGTSDRSSRRIQQNDRELAGAGDVTLFTHDPVTGKYLALVKFYSPTPVAHESHLRSRAYAWLDRLDAPYDLNQITRIDLVPPAAEINGNQPHDEYYASTAWRVGAQWLGGLKIWHGGGDYPHSAAGCAFMKLVSSRDGLHWTKIPYANDAGVPEVWLANGVEGANGGQSDGGYITEFSTGPLNLGDEFIYYYGASSWGKNHPSGVRITGGGIFRARMRIDGFVSVDSGVLTTKPLAFEGGHLTLNSSGTIGVEVLSTSGESLGTANVTGDGLALPVRFGDATLRGLAEEGVCRLRFSVRESGRLYAFAVE